MGFSIMADAVIAQASGAWPTLGGGMHGFGQRVGVSAAGEEAASFFSGFLFPTLFHQDPRYFRSHQTRIIDRLAYAASRVVIGRSDDGRSVINYSAISGQFVQAAVSNAYVPYRNESVSGTIENALAGLSGVAQAQILNEFWPDIKHSSPRTLRGCGKKNRQPAPRSPSARRLKFPPRRCSHQLICFRFSSQAVSCFCVIQRFSRLLPLNGCWQWPLKVARFSPPSGLSVPPVAKSHRSPLPE